MRSRKWLWIACGALCALAVGVAYLARPSDDLAFLEQWQPIHETRFGDMAHPEDPAYGVWTVLRFRNTHELYGLELTNGTKSSSDDMTPDETRKWEQVPDLEELLKSRMAGLVYQDLTPTTAYYTYTIRNPEGGPDRHLWAASVFSLAPDRYQVWIKQEPWPERALRAIKRRLGLRYPLSANDPPPPRV
ncbi:MAG: hypothetical protein ACHQ50_07690 [Fimbriimonadales bacterium]